MYAHHNQVVQKNVSLCTLNILRCPSYVHLHGDYFDSDGETLMVSLMYLHEESW